jgi:hypothetical protein
MNSANTVSRYIGGITTGLWTLEWIVSGYRAFQHIMVASNFASSLNLVVTLVCSVFGCIMTSRTLRRIPGVQTEEKPEVVESWPRRIVGWIGVFVWCAVAVIWNLAVCRTLVTAAADGQAIIVLVLIPFSVVGWVLMNVLLVTIRVMVESWLGKDETVKRWP